MHAINLNSTNKQTEIHFLQKVLHNKIYKQAIPVSKGMKKNTNNFADLEYVMTLHAEVPCDQESCS